MTTTLAMAIGIWLSGLLPTQVPRELVEQALDEPARVAFSDITLREAVNKLTEQTGVRIDIAPDVLALIPGGAQTVITELDLTNAPLRQGLSQLFAPLGLEIAIRNGFVEVVPKDAILCLGRAPSWKELELLQMLASMSPGLNSNELDSLRPLLQFKVAAPDTWAMLSGAIQSVGAGPGDEVLTLACERLGLAWCLSQDRIVVGSLAEQNRQRLNRTVSLRMNYRPLIDVIHEISTKIGMPVRIDPVAIASLPMQVQRSFSLNATNAPVEHILDKVAVHTGLAYVIEPEGVMFYSLADAAQNGGQVDNQSQPVNATDPYVGKLVVPLPDGTFIEWHIRLSELPSDLQNRRLEDLRKAFEELRRQPN